MKIAQITECLTDNGVTTVIRNLSAGLREAGHEVDIITWRDSPESDQGERRVAIRGLSDDASSWGERLLRTLIGRRLFQYCRSGFYARQLQQRIDFGDYDAVVIHGLACIPLWRLPKHFFIVAHSTKSKMLLRPRQLFLRPLLRFLYARMYRAHPLICVSQGAREDMIANFGVDPDRVAAIYNPFPLAEIRRKALEEIDDVPADYLLAVGRPVRSKRFDRLMRVYKMSGIAAPLLVMVGTGKAKKIESLARRYGIAERVQVVGYRGNPYPYMARARLLALTSDYEGLPTVLIESLICGTPVVSTDCPSGPAEILSGDLQRGLIEPGAEKMFAERLREMFENPCRLDSSALERFSQRQVVTDYIEIFEGQESWTH